MGNILYNHADMKTPPKYIFIFLAVLALLLPFSGSAQEPQDQASEFSVARVLSIEQSADPSEPPIVTVKILKGKEKGAEIKIRHMGALSADQSQKIKRGEKIIVVKVPSFEGQTYYITDKYRLPALAIIFAIFLSLAVFFGRLKGFTSILGLIFSILVLAKFVVPKIINGGNALLVSLTGALIIAAVSLFLAHGFNKKTTIAALSTLITLVMSGALSFAFVAFAKLFGMGSEESFYLQLAAADTLNLRGLLLGGIIIGSLGVLDDITTAQTAVVYELKKANSSLSLRELYKRGFAVGGEHIASLVNTLALAYAGASLPLFLLFAIERPLPSWVAINSEYIAEEIIRTLVGSTALLIAVPVTTLLAAYFFAKSK